MEKAVFSQSTEENSCNLDSFNRAVWNSEQAADIFTPLLHSSYITKYQNTAKESFKITFYMKLIVNGRIFPCEPTILTKISHKIYDLCSHLMLCLSIVLFGQKKTRTVLYWHVLQFWIRRLICIMIRGVGGGGCDTNVVWQLWNSNRAVTIGKSSEADVH